MPDLLLTAQDSSGHIHLIIGSGSLANARCTKSLQVGAKAKVVAPAHAEFHHALSKRVENGEAEWIRKDFEEKDLMRYGRNEVDNVVDGVFVTSGGALGGYDLHPWRAMIPQTDEPISSRSNIKSMPSPPHSRQCD